MVFEDIVKRGIRRILVIISDNFPGIIETVKPVFPLADHQPCFVYLQRNIRRHINQIDSTKFNRELSKLRSENSLE
jgi:transposase-like protein